MLNKADAMGPNPFTKFQKADVLYRLRRHEQALEELQVCDLFFRLPIIIFVHLTSLPFPPFSPH